MSHISKRQVALSLDSRLFELILLPTEQCNFRCTYCYEDFQIGKMSREVREGVKNLIASRADSLQLLNLSWFGGEPLAALDVLTEIAEFAMQQGDQHRFPVVGGLTTNGYLLSEKVLATLGELNHRSFQITLDGDREQHNKTRIKANGSGTFDRIWRNLELIRDFGSDFNVTLRIHVSRAGLEGVRRLLDQVQAAFGSSRRFSIHFHRISDLGGPGGKSVEPLGWSEYKTILDDLTGRTEVQSSSEVKLSEEGEICYAAKPNSLLVRADGRVGKCTVALNDPRNDVGVLHPDGTITFHDGRLRNWFEGFKDFNAQVLGCPLSTLAPDPMQKKRAIGPVIEAALV